MIVNLLHGHTRVVAGKGRSVDVRGLLQRVDDVVGGERVGLGVRTGMAHHVVAQLERPDLLAVDDLRLGDRRRDVRLDLGAVARHEANQAVEDHIDDGAILRAGGEVRVERGQVRGVDTEAEDRPVTLVLGDSAADECRRACRKEQHHRQEGC